MSNETDTLGAQPTDQTKVSAAGEQPDAADLSTAIANLNEASLSQALGFSDAPVATPEPDAPAEADETPAGEQPVDETPAAETPDAKPKGRLSVRALPVDEQKQLAEALEMVREGHAPTVYAALQSLAGPVSEATPATREATPAAPTATQSQTPSAVAEIESQLTDLRAQRKAAHEEFDTALASDLTDQIEDTIANLSAARSNAVLQQQAQGAWQNQYVTSVDAMEAKYPEAMDETTPFYQFLDDKVTAAEARKDPALSNPNYILEFADQVAAFLRTPGVKPPAPPIRAKAPVGASVAPGHSQAPRVTADQVKELINSATPAELGAVIFDH